MVTRREFVRGAASLVALSRWMPQTNKAVFAYVASADDLIHAFQVRGDQWITVQQIASTAPAAIAISGNTLYAANDIRLYDRLPRGSVEWFGISENGSLMAKGRIALSLSATHPRSLAVSPDGKWLAVASHEDGIYNLLPIGKDGQLSVPSAIFKSVGCSHPYSLRFDSTGTRLISCEENGGMTVLAVEDGQLVRSPQAALPLPQQDLTRIMGEHVYYGSNKVANVHGATHVALTT